MTAQAEVYRVESDDSGTVETLEATFPVYARAIDYAVWRAGCAAKLVKLLPGDRALYEGAAGRFLVLYRKRGAK